MRPKTEELLYFFLWSCDLLMRPTYRNLTGSFEGWIYRNGFHRQLAELERQQWLEGKRSPNASSDRVDRVKRLLRLTEAGRLHALGGRDPAARWKRPWDRRWRLIVFDLPVTRNALRNHLRKQLRQRGFGCLQGSVWITPHSLQEEKSVLIKGHVDAGSLILLEARPCGGESDEEIVASAWDFPAINQAYAKHKTFLATLPAARSHDERAARALRVWAREERTGWLAAVSRDPLLPEELLPPAYLGRDTWQFRTKILREAAKQMRSFKNEDCVERVP